MILLLPMNVSIFSLHFRFPTSLQKSLGKFFHSQISWEKNQELIGKTFRCIVDRLEGGYYIARTEFDSPEVDNHVLISSENHYLQSGHFIQVRIDSAEDFDLYGTPV